MGPSSFCWLLALCATTTTAVLLGESGRKCQEITIPMCRGIGYNRTSVPNQFKHQTQEDAGMEVHQFWPLVEINCSPDLRFFLCSMYTPICLDDYPKPLHACRSVCERAKAGCIHLMLSYGFQWPAQLECDKLPVFGNPDELCMDSNQTERQQKPSVDWQPPFPTAVVSTPARGGGGGVGGIGGGGGVVYTDRPHLTPPTTAPSSVRTTFRTSAGAGGPQCHNSTSFMSISDQQFVVAGNVTGCAYRCRGALGLNANQYNFMHFWIGVWASLCCVSTLITVLTFAIDMTRFRYPERPIIFLSFCYFMVSLGYMIRIVAGHDSVACDGDRIRAHSTSSPICIAVFVLIYFFGMASSVWWVNIALTWFLAAGLKWSNEAISGYSQYFHIFAWALPSMQTVAVLCLAGVDGDPVSGVCYVGNTDVTMQRFFVLGPLFAYLVLGSFFLFSGFVSLFRIRNMVKQQCGGVSKIAPLNHLIVRIGIFSVCYTIPALIVVGCYFYEQHYRERWELTLLCRVPGECADLDPTPLDFPMFAVKYLMCLAVGISSSVWIWSPKTLDSWKDFFANRLCCCCFGRRRGSSSRVNAAAYAAQTQQQQLLFGAHQPLIRDFYEYNNGGPRSKAAPSSAASYMPADAIVIKSHTDISSGYSRHYPFNHV